MVLAMGLVSGCGPKDPKAAQIDNIQDAAEAQADNLEADADNQVDQMRSKADSLVNQAKAAGEFDAERLNTQADALRKEARIVERQGAAKAKAIRDQAQAEVSAIKAR
jgi:vacuolar-type H+-ATPase subunit H